MTDASITAAIRTILVNTGLVNAKVWLRFAPENASMPYIVLNGNLTTTSALKGDNSNLTWSRQFSVDLWQNAAKESSALIVSVRDALDGAILDLSSGKAWHVTVESSDDIPEPIDTNVVHHTFTCSLKHDRVAV